MCAQLILHHSTAGFVIYCEACQHFQVAYGTSFYKMSEDEFVSFCNEVYEMSAVASHCKRVKNQWLTLPDPNSMMILNGAELHKLREILLESEATLQVKRLFNELENGEG